MRRRRAFRAALAPVRHLVDQVTTEVPGDERIGAEHAGNGFGAGCYAARGFEDDETAPFEFEGGETKR